MQLDKIIRGGICHSTYQYAKANIYMQDYDKNKELSCFQYWNANKLYSWAMLQKLLVNNFQWIKDISQFNDDFIKNFNEKVTKDVFLKLMFKYTKKLHELHNYLLFLPERMKIEKVEKLVANLIKLNMLFTEEI